MKPIVPVLAAALAACSAGTDDGAAPTARGEAPGTVFAASAERGGSLKVALPGAKLDLDVPAGLLDSGDFDIDGVKLYPGSTIDGMDIKATEDGAKDRARVRVAYTAPADPATVRAWFLSQTAKRARPLRAAGDGLAGATDDGDAITLRFVPAGNATKGTILVEG